MVSKDIRPIPIFGVSLKDIQDYINHLLGIKSDVSAPIIISIIIFIVGFIFNGIIRTVVNYNQRDTIRKMFIYNLKTVIKDMGKQSVNFKNLADQLIFKDSNNFILKDDHMYQINILQEIGYKQTFNAFFTGFENSIFKIFRKNARIVAFHSIWESIEFATKWQNKPQEDSKEFVKYYNNQNQNRNRALAQYFQFIEPFLLKAPHLPNLIDALKYYVNEVDKIHVQWQKTANRINPANVQRKLVLPIRILNRKFDNVEIVYQTNKPLLEASYAYSEMAIVLKVYKDIFNDYSIAFHNKSQNITNSIKIL
ncbi:MAG: hypothetical protein NVSMB24_07590 [Mucilaginibacter sp.]